MHTRGILMFDKMKFKIKNLVILTFSVGFIIIGIASYSVIRSVIYDNFIDFSEKNITQKINNINIYSKFIEETSKQISTNLDVISFLTNKDNHVNVVDYLDSVKQSHFGILGVALFDISGTGYLSNYTSSYPSLNDLEHNDTLGKLLALEQKSFWSLRTNDIAVYYNNTNYNKEYGVITFVSKLYDDKNSLCGYLFVDIDPQYIYSFFKNSTSAFPSDTMAYISNNDSGILSSKLNHNLNKEMLYEITSGMGISNGYKISSNKDLALFYNNYMNNNKIIVAVPLTGLYSRLNHMALVMIVLIFVLIIASVFISIMLTNSISTPLTELYKKMKNSSL